MEFGAGDCSLMGDQAQRDVPARLNCPALAGGNGDLYVREHPDDVDEVQL
jgi:hypothetical protein